MVASVLLVISVAAIRIIFVFNAELFMSLLYAHVRLCLVGDLLAVFVGSLLAAAF